MKKGAANSKICHSVNICTNWIKYLEKRDAEADPEADPWFYSTANYHPYAYGYPYASAYAAYPYAYGYAGYPYAYGYAGYPYVTVAKPKEE